MKTLACLVIGHVMLMGCTASQESQTIAVTQAAVDDGSLFCQSGQTLIKAGAVKVTNAQANAVAAVCSGLVVAGALVSAVPVPATAGQSAVVASVPAPLAAAVVASASAQ